MAETPTDGLWKTTCFELFLGDDASTAYTEFNFSPDGQWACYHFARYRSDFDPDHLPPIAMVVTREASQYGLQIEPSIFPMEGTKVALSAVIEETDGTKSYWALAHPSGKPDFHHPDCFALTLGAPSTA